MDQFDLLSQIFNQQQQQQGLGVLDPNAPQIPMPQQMSAQVQTKQKMMMPADVGAPILAITRPKTNVMDAVAQFSNPNFQKAFGGLQTQREGLGQWEEKLNQLNQGEGQKDLTPLLMLSDALTGSKFTQMYRRPLNEEERRMQALGLEQKLQEQKNQLSDKEIDLFKAQAGFDAATAQRQAMERIAGAKIDAKGDGLTPGQEALDKKFGQEYADFVAGGGYTATEQNLQKLESAASALSDDKNNVTGPGISLLPDFVRARGAEQSKTIQDYVESVVQTDLKRVLGAQFTEKEGAQLIKRSYDPRLSQKENLSRVNNLIKQIRSAAQTKQEAADYFEQNGSLKGWKGSSKINVGGMSYDIAPGAGGSTGATGGGQKNLQDPEFLAWKKSQGL